MMVRTYAFNPSTQSHLAGDASTFVPPALVLHSALPQSQQREPPSQRMSSHAGCWTQPGPFLPSSSSTLSSSSSTGQQSSTTAVIQEDQTTIFTIRSVLINGQRFFQPLEGPPQSAVIPSNPAFLAVAAVGVRDQHKNSHVGGVEGWPSAETENGHEREEGRKQQQPQSSVAGGSGQMLTKGAAAMFGLDPEEGGLPWARGNPQPKSGLRGSLEWHAAQHQKNAFNQSYGSSTLSWPPGASQFQQRAEQERHRLELLRQIEENRARRAHERQQEWEAEERQRIKDELWQQRQRLEMEEERRREREKAMMAELKAAKLAEARRATEEALIREAKVREQAQGRGRRREEEDLYGGGQMREEEQAEEWWERKDRIRAQQMAAARQRAKSPAVPAIQRRRQMSNGNEWEGQRSLSVGSRGSQKSRGRQSRLGYSPSAASRKSTMNWPTGEKEKAEEGRRGSGGMEKRNGRDGRTPMEFDV